VIETPPKRKVVRALGIFESKTVRGTVLA